MAQSSPWDALTQAHSEKVVAAVAEVLRADGTLAALFGAGTGGIIISPDPLLHLDLPAPCLVVSPLAQSSEMRTGGELRKTITIRIFVLYQELRRAIDTDDKTVKALLEVIEAALFNNYTLRVAAFSMANLVTRIDSIQALDFGAIGEGANIKRIQTLQVDYWYTLKAATGQP